MDVGGKPNTDDSHRPERANPAKKRGHSFFVLILMTCDFDGEYFFKIDKSLGP
jgi:hypothetical protein